MPNAACLCQSCFYKKYGKKIIYKAFDRYMEEATSAYKNWLGKVKHVPEKYPTLTEAQWLAACKRFNGCAFCGSESIDSRLYFIDRKHGGRYCDWNILPACERCALSMKTQPNPFIRMGRASHIPPTYLDPIVFYLEDKLNAAIAEHPKSADNETSSAE